KLLREDGLIRRIDRYQLLKDGKKPYCYSLTLKGAECLAEYLGCAIEDLHWRKKDTRLRPNFIEHLLLTNDVYLAIKHQVRKTPGLELVEWRDELDLAKSHHADKLSLEIGKGKIQRVSLVPDAYFLLRTSAGQERHHFV